MSVAILSDVHGNAAALEAVLKDIAAVRDCDTIWNLGDTVGYGPEPGRCLELLAAVGPRLTLVGNHDLACIGRLDISQFNVIAQRATEWTAGRLDDAQRTLLGSYPQTAISGDVTLAHGSPRSPIWEYVISAEVARENMTAFLTQLCFVGHTHVAAVASYLGNSSRVRFRRVGDGAVIDVADERAIINPGSVGQPRDGDSRAAWMLFDIGRATVEMRRTEYPIEVTQRAIAEAGLPEALGVRLSSGR